MDAMVGVTNVVSRGILGKITTQEVAAVFLTGRRDAANTVHVSAESFRGYYRDR